MAFQDQGIIFPFQVGKGTQGKGSGAVGGAEQILAAGVEQVQAFRNQTDRVQFLRDIVRQGGGGAVGRNGQETIALITSGLPADFRQFFGSLPFGDVRAGRQGSLQPVEEFFQGQAIYQVGFFHSGYLDLVLDGLAQGYRRAACQGTVCQGVGHQGVVEVIIQGIGVEPER